MGLGIGRKLKKVANVLTGGLYGHLDKLRKKFEDWLFPEEEPTGLTVEKSGTDHAIPVIYGRRKVGAIKVFKATTDSPGGAKNEFLHLVCVFCEGEVESIDTIYFNDIPENEKDSNWFTVERYLGTDNQPASSLLNEAFPNWTANHKLSGLCYAYIRLKQNDSVNIWQGEPEIKAVIKGKKILDIRDDSYAYSNNPALCLYDYLTSPRYGKGAKLSWLDKDSFIDAANFCDSGESYERTITRLDWDAELRRYFEKVVGTEIIQTSLINCNILVDTNNTVFDNVKSLLSGMRGSLIPSRGLIRLLIENEGSSTFEFNNDNIDGVISSGHGGKSKRFNRVIVRYADEILNFEPNEVVYPEPTSDIANTWLAEDNNVLLETDITFNTITNKAEAMQMAQLIANRSRQDITCSFSAFPETMLVEPNDIISVTNDLRGWDKKLFRVNSVKLGYEGSVSFKLTEHQNSVYPWAVDGTTEEIPDTYLSLPEDIGAPTNVNFTFDNGSLTRSGFVSWDEDNDQMISHYVVQVLKDNQLLATYTAQNNRLDIPFFANGNNYRVQVAAANSHYQTEFTSSASFAFANYNRVSHASIKNSLTDTWNKTTQGFWLPSSDVNTVTATFYQGAEEIAKTSVNITLNESNGTLSASQGQDSNSFVTWTVSGNKSKLIYLTFDYDDGVYQHSVSHAYNALIDGVDGINGTNGINGQDGANGIDGRDGQDGTNGRNGIDGQNGSNGRDGVNGQDGDKGDKGDKGNTGDTGPAGQDGADGSNGQDGQDGADGQRGSQSFYENIRNQNPPNNNRWADSVANAAISKLGLSKVVRDTVTLFNPVVGQEFAETRYWSGSGWTKVAQVIDGGLLVRGSISSEKIQADAIQAQHLAIQSTGNESGNSSGVKMEFDPYASSPINIRNKTNNESIFAVQLIDGQPKAQVTGTAGADFVNNPASVTDDVKKSINPYFLGSSFTGQSSTGSFSSGASRNFTISTSSGGRVVLKFRLNRSANYTNRSSNQGWTPPNWTVTVRRDSVSGSILYRKTYQGSAYNHLDGEIGTWEGGYSIDIEDGFTDDSAPLNTAERYYIIVTRNSGTATSLTLSEFRGEVPGFLENEIRKSSSGYWQDKETGFMLQWGSQTMTANLDRTITFAKAFNQACAFVVPNLTQNDKNAMQGGKASNWNRFNFRLTNAHNSTQKYTWFALGY